MLTQIDSTNFKFINYYIEHSNVCFLVCLEACSLSEHIILKIVTTANEIYFFNNFNGERTLFASTRNAVTSIDLKIPFKHYETGEKIEDVFIIPF